MLTLVLGGAASGKSAYAESLCLRSPLPRTYLATMQVWDDECAARVAKHRAMRAEKQFATVECPLHLDRVALPRRGTVLLEGLGNLTANELYDPDGAGGGQRRPFCAASKPSPRSVTRWLLSLTRCSAAGRTTRAIPTAICARWPPSTTLWPPVPTPSCGSSAACPSIIKEAKQNDSFADNRGCLCDVFGHTDAAI